MSQQDSLDIIRQLATAYEGKYQCKCAELHTIQNPKTATGHVWGCPVDDAVRWDLASAGIV